MATENRHDWRALCRAVSVEQDSERLRELLADLLKTMDEPGVSANDSYTFASPQLGNS
jgi:hypothetical protein